MANPNIADLSIVRAQSSTRQYVTTTPVPLLENTIDSNEVLRVNSISISNTDQLEHDITIQLVRDSVAYRILSTVKVPADSTLVAINKEIGFYLLEGDTLEVFASATNRLNAVCSYDQLAEYEVADRLDIEGTPTGLDDFASSVVLLITANGTNAAQNNTFVDSSNNNFTVTRTGNATQGSFSPFSAEPGKWSNYFDGVGDYLDTQSNIALALESGDWTIEFWINFSSTSASNTNIYDQRTATGTIMPVIFRNTSNQLAFSVSEIARITSTDVITTNRWYHFALTKSVSSTKMFIDGVQQASVFNDTFNYGTNRVRLGTNFQAAGLFNGYLSNVRIIKGTAVYTTAFTPSTTPLTAITNTALLTCQSNTFKDNSSNNFALTRNGDVKVTPFSPFVASTEYSASTKGSGYFDGTDYLTVNSSSIVNFGTGNFTIELYFYPNIAAETVVFDGRTATSLTPTIRINLDGTIEFTSDATTRIIGAGLAIGAWNHIAVSRSGTSTRMFCNGVQVGSTYTDTTSYISGTNRPTIGASGFTLGNVATNGYISEVRVLKGTALYTANFTPPTAPLTAITNTALLLNFTNAGVVDMTGKNNLETVGNAQISTSIKRYGSGSVAFDGSGDSLSFPASRNFALGSGNYTIEYWIYYSSLSTNQTILDFRLGSFSDSRISFYQNKTGDGGKFAIATETTSRIISDTVFAASQWYHIALVRNSGVVTLYVNGTAQSQTWTDSTDWSVDTTFRVGTDYSGGLNPVNGYIDDLRITKGVARYTANFTPPTELLI